MPTLTARCTVLLQTACLACLTASAAAQLPGGTAEDYARAESLPGRVRGLVRHAQLGVRWLDATTLLYRRVRDDGEAEFVRVDATTGARITLDEADLTGDEVESLPSVRAARSRDDGGATTIVFLNRTEAPVQVAWLDRTGEAHTYATIAPEGRHRQTTFAGHLWCITAEDGRELGRFRAVGAPATAVAVDPPPPAEPEPAPRTAMREPGFVAPRGFATLVEQHDLWLRTPDAEPPRRLTRDGTAEDPYTGRVWWSPAGTHLVALRERPAERHLVHLVESAPEDQLQPKLHEQDYLKPGDRIAHPRPVLVNVVAGTSVPIDDALFPNPWSIGEVAWSHDGGSFSFLYNERGHRVVRLVRVDAATGKSTTIVEETPETFVDYANKVALRRLADTGEALWMSERSGWNHLELVDMRAEGERRPLTGGPWVIRAVDALDESDRTVQFRAMGVYPGQDPYHVHHGRVSLDGGPITWLTEGDGTHELDFGPDERFYVDTWSRVDHPPVHELRRASDGTLVTELERADWSPLLATGWTPPERFVAKGRDGATDIWGVIFRPSVVDPASVPGARLPVVEQIYAGPHGHFVPKSFRPWHGAQAIAELGFAVVQIDGMGTNWRSKAFHDVAWRNLGDSGFPDRIAWIRAAAETRPWMDLDRVGIYGGSAGGQSALRALLAHGDFYDAAVADCGCHDNRMDKIWWNELWMSWPIGDHYARQSNVTNAHRLEGDLLLIVGELDRNVDPASTMQVVKALIDADKDFDLLVMPGVGHGAAETRYGKRRRADFLVRKLLGAEPRR